MANPSNSTLEEISDLLDSLTFQACVQLTRRLLATISSLPKGAACPLAVLKTVILLVAKYSSTPYDDKSGLDPTLRLLECARCSRQEA